MDNLIIAILAAGRSARMRGGDKLLEPIRGVALLRLVAQRALACGNPVLVTLPPSGARWAALQDLDVVHLAVADAHHGMSSSFRAIGKVASGRAVMILLADMPEIEASDMQKLAAEFGRHPTRIVRAATEDGIAGQPVVFPPSLVARFSDLSGDTGARALLTDTQILVPLPGKRAVTDLDTPEAWLAWRQRSGIRD